MSRLDAVDDQYNPHAVEDRVTEYWHDVDAAEQTRAHRAEGEPFFFVDGPPYTSGAAHMGTTWNKVLKDAYIRYHRMQGYDVSDRPGYDMHGLPIETRVEEELGFENKKDIEAYGEDNFIEDCKEYAHEQLAGLQADFQSFGVWMDWADPYRTVTPEYMEAAWYGFERANDRGLVEQGKRSVSQCPRCETAIAKNEVEYEVVEDPSIYVKFPIAERGDASSETADGSLVIWTTTPWTIPANTFVAVAAEEDYVGVDAERADGTTERLYVAAGTLDEVLEVGGYEDGEVVEDLAGGDMVGWTYDHPLADRVDHPGGEGAFEVYNADYVEVDRTGLVHSAPGHGEEDFRRGTELGLDVFCPVGPDGSFSERAGAYAGALVRQANTDIIEDLEAGGYMLSHGTVDHDYGHCWRCDTGIVQIVTDQWFITITDVKEEMLANIKDSEWYPAEARDGRFRKFVENSPDWNVSRQRYWGIPIPIWTPPDWSGDMADAVVIGSRADLAERVDQDVDPETLDLHKDTVDDLTITEDGLEYTRVPDVFDVWLDSSVASWGTLDYPAEEGAFEELWPADLIIEAHDQTRGWFWSQLAMGTAAMGESPYEQVVMHGHALMPDGRAMSKSKDILVDPHEVIEEYGVDPMRLFLLSVTPRGDDMRFSWEETEEMQRRLNILWNVFRFPLPYMRMDGFDPTLASETPRADSTEAADGTTLAGVEDDLEVVDRWLISRLQAVEHEMGERWEDFEQDKALDALLEFVVEDLSRFYVQVVRERMWQEGESASKQAAYATYAHVLRDVVVLLAPYAPHIADDIYGTLTGEAGHDTVHMCDWPEAAEGWRDPALEDGTDVVRAVEEAGSNARQQAERKLRWPVPEVIVDVPDERVADLVRTYDDLVAERLNAREVTVVGPDEGWGELRYAAEADMSKLGPAFGEDAGEIMTALNEARVAEARIGALEAAVREATGHSVDLTEEMVEFTTETPDGVAGTEFEALGSAGVVYVDTGLTEDIESEGYAREVIRRVQEMRKDLDLAMDARIRVDLEVADDRVDDLVRKRADLVAEEVRADAFGDVLDGHRRTWDVEGVEFDIAITQV